MEQVKISDFFSDRFKKYSMYVIEHRAIPSVIDGLKTSQRKILAEAFNLWKTNNKFLKVFQFAGSVAYSQHYHHSNSSLEDTIIGMCQSFKNNICYFNRDGQFGTILHPTSGDSRYVGCSLNNIVNHLFLDNNLLNYNYDDGTKVEPIHYLPIIPTVLVNGTSGIAVGVASNILNRDSIELIDSILEYIQKGKITKELKPKYSNYDFKVKQGDSKLKWIYTGEYEILNDTTLRIFNLPPSVKYDDIEELLREYVANDTILKYENDGKHILDVKIKFRKDILKTLSSQQIEKMFKLNSNVTENLTTLDEFGKLKIFESVQDIIKYFVDYRITFYQIRKDLKIKDLNYKLMILENKLNFIQLILDKKLKINNIKKSDIIKDLTKLNFALHEDSYNYLLDIPIHSLSIDTKNDLINSINKLKSELNIVLELNPKTEYILDLKNLRKKLNEL